MPPCNWKLHHRCWALSKPTEASAATHMSHGQGPSHTHKLKVQFSSSRRSTVRSSPCAAGCVSAPSSLTVQYSWPPAPAVPPRSSRTSISSRSCGRASLPRALVPADCRRCRASGTRAGKRGRGLTTGMGPSTGRTTVFLHMEKWMHITLGSGGLQCAVDLCAHVSCAPRCLFGLVAANACLPRDRAPSAVTHGPKKLLELQTQHSPSTRLASTSLQQPGPPNSQLVSKVHLHGGLNPQPVVHLDLQWQGACGS